MSVKLRLARAGAKKNPYYHLVAADSRKPRDGKFLEAIGSYYPGRKAKDKEPFEVNVERLNHWLKSGAQPTGTVGELLKRYHKAHPEAAAAAAAAAKPATKPAAPAKA
jgi:small subunit ribosomal protein S16